MTREEFIDEMHRYRVSSYRYSYVDELEARIVELETPKNCDGCKYNTGIDEYNECNYCIRHKTIIDYYEPKETK